MIHPTAIVSDRASIGEDTRIGPYCIVEDSVKIGAHCNIHGHAVLKGNTTIGDHSVIHPFCVIGGEPQHLQYKGEPTKVVIGKNVTLRESVTVHRGTAFGGGVTTIEDHVYLMAYTHIAHDSVIGQNTIIANSGQIAGHVSIGRSVNIGGQSAVTQHCRVGDYAFLGGGSLIRKDLLPFLAGKGNEFQVQGINAIGLERSGFSQDTIRRLKAVYKIFFLQKLTVSKAIERILMEVGETDEVRVFLDFVKSSKMGFIR